jgi:ATP-dependent DNA helicase RecQ
MREVMDYADLNSCRRRHLLGYFGESYAPENCGSCDECLSEKETFDATIVSQKILSAIVRTGERFGAGYIADILKGKKTKQIKERGHDTLSVYGIVQDFSVDQLREIIRSLIGADIIRKTQGEYPTLELTKKGRLFLSNKESLSLPKPKDDALEEKPKTKDDIDYDEILFEKLRTLRKQIAGNLNVPPFVVFSDVSLREMAGYFPSNETDFLKITGVGEQKLKNFGQTFLQAINDHAKENNIQPKEFSRFRTQKSPRKITPENVRSGTFRITQEFLERQMSIAEIAKKRGLTEGTIISHIEKIIFSDQTINIEHLKPSKKIFEEIQSAFKKCGQGALGPVHTYLDNTYDYDLLRLVRLFLK